MLGVGSFLAMVVLAGWECALIMSGCAVWAGEGQLLTGNATAHEPVRLEVCLRKCRSLLVSPAFSLFRAEKITWIK